MPLAERQEFLDAARDVVARVASCPNIISSRIARATFHTMVTTRRRRRASYHIYVEDGYAIPRLREISEVSEAVRGLGRG